ncbi:hypothetical protein ACQUW5_10335 [Legionella sp. CNM-1927-20]|uniref:hypothetical protein n=1 Tax=Legionella sp. CNM-1927-20 TaxID=3422221 RepID=UPI00403B07B0
MSYRDGLKFSYTKMDALAVLGQPVSALLGVSDKTEETLNKLGIKKIYDLASSPLFKLAFEIANAAYGGGNSITARLGRIPSSFIDSDSPATPASLVEADIALLREIDKPLATEIKKNLQIETVGDLGRWPPFCAAQVILNAAIPPLHQDEEASELVPRLGEYPTERHYYQSVVIDHVTPGETTDLNSAGPIDISPTVSADFGFKAPAVGAVLTFAQSWFAQGITLGNLLHSVALAPGESTRIAVLNWARQTRAAGEEAISESEKLTNTSTHNRAISEVQEAVASEVQTGFSRTNASSTTSAGGGGLGLSLGPLTLGGSGSSATTTSNAESFSSSAGTRNLAATMNQRVSDATQQAASSVRDRRASIVKEVSEEEHQSVSTRIIANYNHMHALTVQYFEVIEIYRVNVQLHQVERCLFIPMKLVNFDRSIIERYQGVLADAALNRRAHELLRAEFGSVMIKPSLPLRPTKTIFDRVSRLDRLAARTATTAIARAINLSESENASTENINNEPAITPTATTHLHDHLSWVKEELVRASRITLGNIVKPGTSDLFLPGETELSGVTFELRAQGNSPITISNVKIQLQSGSSVNLSSINILEWIINDAIPIQEISDVRVSSTSTSYLVGKLTLQLNYGSAKFPISIPIEVAPNAIDLSLCRFIANEGETELSIHLEQNRLHYSQAIWRTLDPSSIALLLSAYTFEGRPIADLIDPNPIMIASNYLVFRMPSFVEAAGIQERSEEDNLDESHKNWKAWLKERGLVLGATTAAEQLVPIPTGGVFAEAVLGRSNSAEKLDATRFWNWQDSPIPLQPPEIAAIQMESRAQPVDATPGHLGAPVLNIMNPTPLPDPTGVGAIINAVQNGNMFRDMAGLAATSSLAQTLAGHATSASTEAGRQAAANLAVAAQKDIEEKRIAAQLALAAMGLPAGNAGSAKNVSESGALLNTATEMDKQSPRTGNSSVNGESGGGFEGSTSPGPGGNGGTESGEPFDDSYMPGVPEEYRNMFNNTSRADEVLSKMNWGSLGQSGASIIPATKGKGRGSSRVSGVISYELACYANFPSPWPDEAAEVQGLMNDKWLPAAEDFDAISPAATSANNQATKPYGQVMNSLADLISSVTHFAPKVAGFGKSHPSRVVRLNLFLYAGTSNMGFMGTLTTQGKWGTTIPANADIDSPGIDAAVIAAIKSNAANKTALANLKKAWGPNAEIWLYTCDGVVSTAFGKKFAKLMGAKVRAFDDPFWVLPTYDATQKIILSRNEFGIGSDFAAAAATRTKDLHSLDSLATRTFKP